MKTIGKMALGRGRLALTEWRQMVAPYGKGADWKQLQLEAALIGSSTDWKKRWLKAAPIKNGADRKQCQLEAVLIESGADWNRHWLKAVPIESGVGRKRCWTKAARHLRRQSPSRWQGHQKDSSNTTVSTSSSFGKLLASIFLLLSILRKLTLQSWLVMRLITSGKPFLQF